MRNYFVVAMTMLFAASATANEGPSYAKQVRPIFAKYCLECHNAKSAKGGLDLATHKAMLVGSDNGAVLKVGKADESLLVQSIEGKGRSLMPPKSKTLRPTKDEIATVRAWIKAGAKDDSASIKVVIPDIKPRKSVLPPVNDLAFSADGSTLVVARGNSLAFVATTTNRFMDDVGGNDTDGSSITAIAIHDKRQFTIAFGWPGVGGSLDLHFTQRVPVVREGKKVEIDAPRQIVMMGVHGDLILDLATSPDRTTLASCSYDTRVKLWDTASGKLLHTLKDHSDSVYGVSFHPSGKKLATCAADRTVKIWDPVTARLLFTFSESTDWNYAVAWRPDGKQLAAAGVDKSIRVWSVGEQGGKIAHAVFAHEGAVTKLIYSKDGGTLYSVGEDRVVKAWDADRMIERKVYERQPETVLCMALRPDQKQLALGRYDGQVVLLDVATGQTRVVATATATAPPVALASYQKPAVKPEAKKISPGEGRRGQPIRVTIEGNHLDQASDLVFALPGASGKILSQTPTKLEAEVVFPPTTPSGLQLLQVKNGAGLSAPLSIIVDPFPLVPVSDDNDFPGRSQPIPLPASLVGKLDKVGDLDFFRFEVKKGQQLGVQILTAAVGSKVEPTLQLVELNGRVLAESNEGLLGHTFAEAGTYALGVRDRDFRGGPGMHYRLHVGAIPVVTALFPQGLQRGTETTVRVEGVFLSTATVNVMIPADAMLGSKTQAPVASTLGQPLGNLNLVVGEFPEIGPKSSNTLAVPGTANGVISQANQQHLWRFHAKKGQRLIVETQAQRIGSTLDSAIEILDAKGELVPRAVLRCQAKTFVTFRDHDNVAAGIRIDAWSDLVINDFIYLGNELIRIKALPTHPDADCNFFASAAGPRLAFLDTTPTHHSQSVPMYKVSIHPPGTTFPPNGFPVFGLDYRNDDGGPGYGRDSRILFDPPADGVYQVRIGDARGQGGVTCGYRLTVRPPRPSFNVRFSPTNPTVAKGDGIPLTIAVDRVDGYEGPIDLRFTDLPPGFSIPRTEIQAGESTTAVALYADAGAKAATKPIPLKLIAEAMIEGKKQTKEAMGEAPKLIDNAEVVAFTDQAEVTLRPGGETKVLVHIERRGGFAGRVPLEVKGMPHGVRVLDIGLNGILVTEGETRRTIVLYAEPWVEPTLHPIVILAKREGKNTEHAAKSVLLKVVGK